jgi:hypothetical protein
MNDLNISKTNEINDLLDLDTSWIDEFEKSDNEFKSYYAEAVTFINLHCVYINKFNEIIKVHEENVLFRTPGMLTREEVLGLIKRNTSLNNKKYSLLSILKFNVNIEPNNLKTFLRSAAPSLNIGNNYLQSIKNIDAIVFDKTIGLFQDINELLIIFYEKPEDNERNDGSINVNQFGTRKIYLNHSSLNLKKTRRNLTGVK